MAVSVNPFGWNTPSTRKLHQIEVLELGLKVRLRIASNTERMYHRWLGHSLDSSESL
jgi:hypothetical protein